MMLRKRIQSFVFFWSIAPLNYTLWFREKHSPLTASSPLGGLKSASPNCARGKFAKYEFFR